MITAFKMNNIFKLSAPSLNLNFKCKPRYNTISIIVNKAGYRRKLF